MFAPLMHRLRFAPLALLAVVLNASGAEDPFKLYPGATRYTPPETEQNKQFANALRPGTTITAYLTDDSFEKVVAFYRASGKEYTSAKKPAADKLPREQRLQKTFFILDRAPDLVSSHEWLSVQHPFVGATPGKDGKVDSRDVTEIVLTKNERVSEKSEPKKKSVIEKQ